MDQQAREDAIRVQDQRAATEQQGKKQQADAEQKREQDALADKYLSTGIVKHTGSKQGAILVLSNGEGHFSDLEDILGQELLNRGLTPATSFFKPQFIQEGRAERLFAGDWGEATQLGIGNRVDVVVIGEVKANAADSSEFKGLITTNLSLELKCLNLDHQSVCGIRSVVVAGAGYTKDESLKNATDKARPEIEAFVKAMRVD
jgi:hypothetical protein